MFEVQLQEKYNIEDKKKNHMNLFNVYYTYVI